MKKSILCLMMILMVSLLAACGSKDTPASSGTNEKTTATEAPTVTKETKTTPEPTKEATPEPTKEATPEPTEEITPEPTEEITPEPTEEITPEPTSEPVVDPDDDNREVDALGNESFVYDVDKSEMIANILNVTEYGPYSVVKVSFKSPYSLPFNELAFKSIGDAVSLNGKPARIVSIVSRDASGDFTIEQNSYEDGCRIVIRPENPSDFYSAVAIENENIDENPANGDFGFVLNSEEDVFYAFTDWAWDDCYVPLYYTVLYGVNLVVTDDTIVTPVYFDHSALGDDFTLTGTEYLQLRADEAEQERRNIHVHEFTDLYITEVTDASGRSTGEIKSIEEIYSP